MTTDALTIRTPDALALAGQAANDAAARGMLTDCTERKATESKRQGPGQGTEYTA